jgi:hypothetical protein
MISRRSCSGMNTYPFFKRNQLSLLMITTSLSPSARASRIIRMWPMWIGSNPPETATHRSPFFDALFFLWHWDYRFILVE